MLTILAFAAIAASSPAVCAADPGTRDSTDLAATWRDGVSFTQFVGGMKDRKADWQKRSAWATITVEMKARVRALSGTWRVLAVTAEQCGDSMSSLPYLAALFDSVPSVEMRLVTSSRGKAIMEAHRTPDGRAATPTVVILDEHDMLVGCYIERPRALLRWIATPKDSLPADQRYGGRMVWYDANKGQAAIGELLDLLERAAKGEGSCP